MHVGVLLDELGHPAGAQAERVLPDQHLAVAVRLPAPMPMVGMRSFLVTCAGDVAGDHLHDDRERAGVLDRLGVARGPASAVVAAALDAVAAEACSDCGVKPMCAITGMPPRVSSSICGAISTPPSSFTQWAPPSFMNRTAVW